MIVANIPPLRKRGVLWFRKNRKNILRAGTLNAFWHDKYIVVREGDSAKLSEFLRRLSDLGYQRTLEVFSQGDFLVKGGLVHVFPINENSVFSLEFFGNSVEEIYRGRKKNIEEDLQVPRKSLTEFLRGGDFIVHRDHGIGIYRGVVTQNSTSYFLIEYAPLENPDTLLVPVEEEKKLSPYIGFRKPTIHRLGTTLWARTFKKTKEDVVAFAKKLLEIFAVRSIKERLPYLIHEEEDGRLTELLGYEKTSAQKRAIREIYGDFLSKNPMDRILLGDVGFGKTDVAMHASLQVSLNGRQVCVLAPTTILCDQHFSVFKNHFREFPILIEKLSRFSSKKDLREVLEKLREGKVDIVIGTHRLLSRDVVFRNLGLFIIDEEQRFGVKAKERLKEFKKDVDVLSLSATPLPRTLSMALSRIRSLSVLNEAPPGRRPPKTHVLPYSEEIVKDAIEKEIARKGQVYFLANRIHSIPLLVDCLKTWVPDAKFGIVHGRLPEKTLVRTMDAFRKGAIDVLVSTTIIENGIDLSNVNTLLVYDSTLLGLADLHQLRGRIGRGNLDSFSYFLLPKKPPGIKAAKRLDILLKTQFLGAGEVIAKKDLEMRGAGNILGREQSGTINKIGLNLYCEILQEAVAKLKI